MIRALIVDDESRAISLLKTTLEKDFTDEFEIETASSPEEGLRKISEFNPELLYLDIEMPGMSGFDMLASLPEINFKVIFTSAHDHYAIRAIRNNALDYLLKPINPFELATAIRRFRQQKDENKEVYNRQLKNLFSNNDKSLAITTCDGVVFLDLNNIIRCEANMNYTKFILTDNKSFLSSKTLKEYEDLLVVHHNFVRIHRSHLINIDYLLKLKKDGSMIMKDNSHIPISRRRKKEVLLKLSK